MLFITQLKGNKNSRTAFVSVNESNHFMKLGSGLYETGVGVAKK